MFRPGDSILKQHTAKRRKWEKEHPERDWKFNLSKEQIKQVEKWRKEASNIRKAK